VLRIEDHDRVRVLTLDRPEALNAFNRALYQAACDALVEAGQDPGVAVVVVTGNGRAFSAGQDLFEMAALGNPRDRPGSGPSGEGRDSAFPLLVDTLASFPKPLLAAVNGIGVGIGFTLLAHCDLVLIAEGARLRTPFTALGVAPEAASSALFPQRMGWQRAAWVLLSSEWIDAAEAVESGIAWRVCPAGSLLSETLEVAGRIARMPIPSLVATKRLMLDTRTPVVQRARRLEDEAFAELLGAPANLEALRAFAERREPDFTNLADA